jgi:hypothetical protein
MPKKSKALLIPDELVINKILLIRGKKVMLDRDLAELYGTTTFRLNEQVKRNNKRFPPDFMFKLTKQEKSRLIDEYAQYASLKFSPALPNVFTEHGAVMLASVLNTERAIEVNIQIVRIFTKIRKVLSAHQDLWLKFEQLEKKVTSNNEDIQAIFSALKQLLNPLQEPRPRAGFRRKNENE